MKSNRSSCKGQTLNFCDEVFCPRPNAPGSAVAVDLLSQATAGYASLRDRLQHPLKNGCTVDKVMGQFGPRFHPVTLKCGYFHTGADMFAPRGSLVYPVADGILHYGGGSSMTPDGLYVLLEHPDIRKEDGQTLYSLYCHLDRVDVRFNLVQKVVRRCIPALIKVPVDSRMPIGCLGASGMEEGTAPHLHLQLFFRGVGGPDRVVNPQLALGIEWTQNTSAAVTSTGAFRQHVRDNAGDIAHWEDLLRLKNLWPHD